LLIAFGTRAWSLEVEYLALQRNKDFEEKMEIKGQVVNTPPHFKGVKYDRWKQQIVVF